MMRVPIAFICSFVFLLASTAEGQWRSVGQFDAPLTAIYFLDGLGFSQTGFVGLSNGGVWKTGDGGNTWIDITPPGEKGPVSSFTFKSTNEGWLSTREQQSTSNVYHTTDAGVTWTGLLINRERPCVYYNPNSRLLFTTSLSNASLSSTDNGQTWTSIVPPGMNSIDFSDGQFGVMSTYNDHFYVTGDGGFSWNRTNFANECWKPLAVKGVHVLFAVSEASNYIYRSTDLGNNWVTMGKLPAKPTGDIEGQCSQLYVQSDSGVFVSADEGATWHFLGGPSNQSDTRFAVIGNTIFAGDLHGGVFRFTDQTRDFEGRLFAQGGNAPPSGRGLRLYSNGCLPDTSQVLISASSACLLSRLDSMTYSTTSGLRVPLLRQLPMNLPPDSIYRIPVFFRPSGTDGDTLLLHLHFTESDAPFDTTVVLIAQSLPQLQLTGDRPSVDLHARVNCTIVKGIINFLNGKCDSVTLDGVSFADSIRFGIQKSSLPIAVGPKGTIQVSVFGKGESKGVYQTVMTLHLHIRQSKFTMTVPVSLLIDGDGTVQTDIEPTRLSFSPTSLCGKRDNVFYIINPACAKYSVTKIEWITGPPSFSIVSQPVLPRTLLAGEEDSVVVRFRPQQLGNTSASLKLTLSADSLQQDTIISISGNGYTISQARLSEQLANFDTLQICSSLDRYAYVRNESCDPTQIVEVLNPTDTGFVVLEPTAPVTVLPGDSIRIHILLDPSKHAAQAGVHFDSVEIRLRNKGGSEQALDLKLYALILPAVRNVLLGASKIVDTTLTPCSTRDTNFTIRNIGTCDTLSITTLSILGSAWFTATTIPPLPVRLLPGDSLVVSVHTNADPLGSALGNLLLHGNGFDTSISLRASVQKTKGPELAVTYKDTSYPAKICTAHLGYVRYQNQTCGKITVDSAWVSPIDSSRSKFSIVGSRLPAVLNPGDTVNIPILFDGNTSGDTAAVLHLHTMEGRTSDTVRFAGLILGAPQVATLSLSVGSASRVGVPIASNVHVTIAMKQAIGDSSMLTQIHTRLTYDDNVLTPQSATGMSGWTVQKQVQSFGSLDLTLTRATSTSIAAGGSLAEVIFSTTVGDALSSSVKQSSIAFNNGDPIYKRCELSALQSPDSVVIAIDPFCGDSLYLRQVLGQPILTSMIIRPNPISGAEADAKLEFATSSISNVMISVVDVRGRELYTVGTATLRAGDHDWTLPTHRLAKGTYFVRLLASGERRMQKIVIQ